MPKIEIEKLHINQYSMEFPHVIVAVTAQDLLDIMDYALVHTGELQQEAAQCEKEHRRLMHLPDEE